jgi:hypothetical protein
MGRRPVELAHMVRRIADDVCASAVGGGGAAGDYSTIRAGIGIGAAIGTSIGTSVSAGVSAGVPTGVNARVNSRVDARVGGHRV